MRRLILILVITAVAWGPFGKPIRSGFLVTWRNFLNALDDDNNKRKVSSSKQIVNLSYSRGAYQETANNQRTGSVRSIFAKLRYEISSETKKNSAGHILAQQRATNGQEFNYGKAALRQQRYENEQAFKQASLSAGQSLAQQRLSMSRELASY